MSVVVRTSRKTVAVPIGRASPQGVKGDPGSPGEGYASRTMMAARAAPALFDDVFLTEYRRQGKFVVDVTADWVAQIAADAEQVIFVLSTADPSKVYRRVGYLITPDMAGAPRYNPDVSEATVNARAGLQACFDLFKDLRIAREYALDWRGEWGTDGKIYAVYWDGYDTPYTLRRFNNGTLRVLSTVSTAAPIDYVLEISGPRMLWEGALRVAHWGHVDDYPGLSYNEGRFLNGVRTRYCSYCRIDAIYVDAAKRYALVNDSRASGGFTANGVTTLSSNNIGLSVGLLATRACGSCNNQLHAADPQTVSAIELGGSTSGSYAPGEEFHVEATSGAYSNSGNQRTRFTVGSTADIEILDWTYLRLELTPAIYGTIAVAAVAGPPATATITWSAGDPTNIDGAGHGLKVGDRYPVFQGGVNAGVRDARITGFSGTSNRVIAVDYPLTAHAASSDASLKQYSLPFFMLVSDVKSSTQFVVSKWAPRYYNSKLYIVHGGAYWNAGSDNANVHIDSIEAFGSGVGYYAGALYGSQIGTFLGEASDVAIQMGYPGGICTGNVISHGHLEANMVDWITTGAPSGEVNFSSNYTLSKMGAYAAVNDFDDQEALGDKGYASASHLGVMFKDGEQVFTVVFGRGTYSSNDFFVHFNGVSNHPKNRRVFIHESAPGSALPVSFDDDVARLFPEHHWAEVHWTGGYGDPPDAGTLTLELTDALKRRGWTFSGAGGAGTSFSIATPAKSVRLYLQFLSLPYVKKVAVMRVNGD